MNSLRFWSYPLALPCFSPSNFSEMFSVAVEVMRVTGVSSPELHLSSGSSPPSVFRTQIDAALKEKFSWIYSAYLFWYAFCLLADPAHTEANAAFSRRIPKLFRLAPKKRSRRFPEAVTRFVGRNFIQLTSSRLQSSVKFANSNWRHYGERFLESDPLQPRSLALGFLGQGLPSSVPMNLTVGRNLFILEICKARGCMILRFSVRLHRWVG